MTPYLVVSIGLEGLVIGAGVWLGWQLLRQNGRILLRLDELEKRLNEIEFGDEREPEGLQSGSAAPAFELPDLSGQRHTLAQYRGQPVLLVFFNPDCGYGRDLAGRLGEKDRSRKQNANSDQTLENGPSAGRTLILLVSSGGQEPNRRFFADHPVACPILLQKDMEVAAAYKANGTPTGYLISAEGKIESELAIGADALLALVDGRVESDTQKAKNEQERTARFSQRSLARSKIQRDGLKAGTSAPEFRLPRLDGCGELALGDLKGRRVLLVFSDPHCGPCETLAPDLEKFHRATLLSLNGSTRVAVVMISRGDPKENRTKAKEYGLTFPIVLQQQWEISRRYAMFATPIAYLIDENGTVTHDVAVGVEAILVLLASVTNHSGAREVASG